MPGSDEVILIADNDTLTATAAEVARERGLRATLLPDQIESDVEAAADQLANSKFDDVLIAGGEVTVTVRGDGKGGRCSELASRYLLAGGRVPAVFASSDGMDGNSGAAGIAIDRVPVPLDRDAIATELGKSNSFPLAAEIGRAIMIPPAGNNLRDLYLLARG
ncbi:MAG TPA: MOFRL family protein [Caulobacteraceae bacterium]